MQTTINKEDFKRAVGERLRAARERWGGTQGEAAEALSARLGVQIGESRIGNYEQGTRLPDPQLLGVLCEIYEAQPAQIYGFQDAPSSREEVMLLNKYRLTDDRGRRAIQSVAESQPAYVIPDRKAQ